MVLIYLQKKFLFTVAIFLTKQRLSTLDLNISITFFSRPYRAKYSMFRSSYLSIFKWT